MNYANTLGQISFPADRFTVPVFCTNCIEDDDSQSYLILCSSNSSWHGDRIKLPYPIDQKLVVAVSTTALFDLREADEIYRTEGLEAFLKFQEENRSSPPDPGTAFPFIQRLLGLNEIYSDEQPIEVVILSRNHPKASLRIMDAVEHYGLNITRASFTAGTPPYPYMAATKAVLYLSASRRGRRPWG